MIRLILNHPDFPATPSKLKQGFFLTQAADFCSMRLAWDILWWIKLMDVCWCALNKDPFYILDTVLCKSLYWLDSVVKKIEFSRDADLNPKKASCYNFPETPLMRACFKASFVLHFFLASPIFTVVTLLPQSSHSNPQHSPTSEYPGKQSIPLHQLFILAHQLFILAEN